ncbi:AVN_HP_G0026130.mRNA.1.CDS.1 [Saccharomyces cerevisiae]|nr:AVN_HP_G0026130.mRNA.1.CDS.1 [Saccharomyces cerevisiae]CAI6798698.1 AVN_HP_G0026130.mRNA.1.CDS.1 [Saccharomyces cerevisiae]
MVSAQSDFIQAELHNINNSVTTDSEFSFHDFENDIGNTLPYRKQLVSGHIIEYDSDSGFSITHPDIIGEIKVDDVLQAYKEALRLNHTAQVENTNVTEITGGTDALARRGQYRCHNNDEQANCGQDLLQGTRLRAPIIARTLVERGTRVLFLKQAAVMVLVVTK